MSSSRRIPTQESMSPWVLTGAKIPRQLRDRVTLPDAAPPQRQEPDDLALAAALREHPRLRQLDDSDLKAMVRCWTFLHVEAGTEVIAQGGPGDAMYFVAEGLLRVSWRGPKGQQETLGRVGAQELFGEMAFFDDAPRMASVIAAMPCQLYRAAATDFRELAQNHPRAASALVEALLDDVLRRMATLSRRLEQEFQAPAAAAPAPEAPGFLRRILRVFGDKE